MSEFDSAADSIPDGDGIPEVPPPPPPPVAPLDTKPPRGARRQGKPFFRSELDRLFPTADRVKFWKRGPDGELRALPRMYRPQDLQRCSDVEEFISRFLVPRYREGDYEVAVIDKDGKASSQQTVSILAETPTEDATDSRLSGVVDRLFEKVDSLEQRLADAARRETPAERPKTLTEQMEEVERLKRTMGGGDNMLLMLMMMNQQGAAAPRRDPEVDLLREQLRELKETLRETIRERAAPPTPPPDFGPAHDTDVGGIISNVLGQIVPLITPQRHDTTSRQDDPIALLERAKGLFSRDDQPDAIRRLEEEIRALRAGPAEKTTLKDAMGTIQDIAAKFGGGGGGASTGDQVLRGIEMVTDPARIEAMGRAVGTWRTSLAPPSTPPRTKNKKLAFPDGFDAYATAIVTAGDNDVETVAAVMRSLEFLGKHTSWQGNVLAMVSTCLKNDRRKAMEYVRVYLDGLAHAGKLTREVAQRALAAFDVHMDTVIEQVRGAQDGGESEGAGEGEESEGESESEEGGGA